MLPTSSPLSSPPPSDAESAASCRTEVPSRLPQYRPPRALPFELSQHILNYFEEALYSQAFDQLISLLSSSSASANPDAPSFVPPPTHLALAATLAIHPSFTTRTTSRDKHEQANSALRLLRLTNKAVGPIGADVAAAFSFKRPEFRISRSGGQQWTGADFDSAENASGEVKIDTPFASGESVWSRAEDFWHVVGWAFNCSCLQATAIPMYGQRWERWSLWLDYMLHVLEDDWEARYATEECDKSLTWQYIDNVSGHNARNRRILRAIFADGTKTACNEFREVFRNELKEPKSDAEKVKKREVNVNIENEIYGDYMGRDDSDLSEDEATSNTLKKRTRQPSSRKITPRNSAANLNGQYAEFETSGQAALLGGVESLNLRLRLLHLLSNVAGQMSVEYMNLDNLYAFMVEFIRPLPLATFQLIVLPSVFTAFSEAAHITLCEKMLQLMLGAAAPNVGEQRFLTLSKLEKFYLPCAANKATVVDNAKVSLLLESLLRYYAMAGTLRVTSALKLAVDRGIKARDDKASSDSRKGRNDDAVAWAWLIESGERMKNTVHKLE